MGKPYSLDLRKRIIRCVEGGGSRRGAADRFGVSVSCAIKLMDRWDRTGSATPGKRGGSVGKLKPYEGFLLDRVGERPDITMLELAEALEAEAGIEAAPASRSRFLIHHGLRFKKSCWPASKAGPTSPSSAMSGRGCASRSCALNRTAWALSTRPARPQR